MSISVVGSNAFFGETHSMIVRSIQTLSLIATDGCEKIHAKLLAKATHICYNQFIMFLAFYSNRKEEHL